MAENEEKKTEGTEAKKGKMLPIMIGIFLVVGAAIATVAFVLPPKEPEVVEIPPIDSFPVQQWPDEIKWNFNLKSRGQNRMAVLQIKFVYKTRDPLIAQQKIEQNHARMFSEVHMLMADKAPSDITGGGGLRQLQQELIALLDRTLFPENEDAEKDEDIHTQIEDVYIMKLVSQ